MSQHTYSYTPQQLAPIAPLAADAFRLGASSEPPGASPAPSPKDPFAEFALDVIAAASGLRSRAP